jgi:two-component system nitrogen regulation sensor histidine kinase NtrY
VSLFSVIAVLPAVLVSIVANVTLDRGLDRLFSVRTRAVIENSLIVANAYLRARPTHSRRHPRHVGRHCSCKAHLYDQDRQTFRNLLTSSAASRNLPGAMLIDKDRHILETAATGITQEFQTPAPDFLKNVTEDEPQIAVFIEQNYVAAVIRLRAFEDTFLYVARLLDPRVVAQLQQTQASVAEYAELESRRLGIQVAFALDVHRDRADRPDVVGADRAELRKLAGGADPAADGRGQSSSPPAIFTSRCRSINPRAISPVSARPSTR